MSATMGKLEDLAKKLEEIDKQVHSQEPTGESVAELSKLKDAIAKVCSVTSKYRQFKCLSFPFSFPVSCNYSFRICDLHPEGKFK